MPLRLMSRSSINFSPSPRMPEYSLPMVPARFAAAAFPPRHQAPSGRSSIPIEPQRSVTAPSCCNALRARCSAPLFGAGHFPGSLHFSLELSLFSTWVGFIEAKAPTQLEQTSQLSAADLRDALKAGIAPPALDVRTFQEWQEFHLEHAIPLPKFPARLFELPKASRSPSSAAPATAVPSPRACSSPTASVPFKTSWAALLHTAKPSVMPGT